MMDYLLPMIGSRREVIVADVGSGPHALRHCEFANGASVNFYPMDKRETPGVEGQNMEFITYLDNMFDIVQCINALDHTKDALKALKELIRVSARWVYIDCNLDQHTTSGGWHYWDAKENGTFTNGKDTFNLKAFGFKIKYINNGGERRYNHIIATLDKEEKTLWK